MPEQIRLIISWNTWGLVSTAAESLLEVLVQTFPVRAPNVDLPPPLHGGFAPRLFLSTQNSIFVFFPGGRLHLSRKHTACGGYRTSRSNPFE